MWNRINVYLVDNSKRTYLISVPSVVDVFSSFLFSDHLLNRLSSFLSPSSHKSEAHNWPLNFLATNLQHFHHFQRQSISFKGTPYTLNMYVSSFSEKKSRSFPLFPPCLNAFVHSMYIKCSELWVKHNLSNEYIMYALGLVHEKFNVWIDVDLSPFWLAQSDRMVQSIWIQICRS